MHFADALTAKIKESSPVCVGLDPEQSELPEGIEKSAAGVKRFLEGIIDAVKKHGLLREAAARVL